MIGSASLRTSSCISGVWIATRDARRSSRYFQEYIEAGGQTPLVLAGPSTLMIPEHPRIRALGYVTDDVRHALLSHARARSSFPRPTKVSASSCSRRGTTRCRRWSTHSARYCRGKCAALMAAWTTAHRASSRKPCRGCCRMKPAGANSASRDWRMSIASTRWPTVLERVESLLDEVSRRRSAPRA